MANPSIDIDLSIFPMAVAIVLGVALVVAPLALYAWWQLGQGLSTLEDPRELSEVRAHRRWLLRLLVSVLALALAIGLMYVSLYVWSDLKSLAQSPPKGQEYMFQPTTPDGQKDPQDLYGKETDEAYPHNCRDGEENCSCHHNREVVDFVSP